MTTWLSQKDKSKRIYKKKIKMVTKKVKPAQGNGNIQEKIGMTQKKGNVQEKVKNCLRRS